MGKRNTTHKCFVHNNLAKGLRNFLEISEIERNLVEDFEDCDETEIMSIPGNRQEISRTEDFFQKYIENKNNHIKAAEQKIAVKWSKSGKSHAQTGWSHWKHW